MENKETALNKLELSMRTCERCALCKSRKNLVFGMGNPDAQVMFIAEAPGKMEDDTGKLFVGKSGQLLDKIFKAIAISREDVYITNIVKCRPPMNRNPLPEEKRACLPYLRLQTRIIKPKVIVLLGSIAAKTIIEEDFKITRQHGQWICKNGFHLIATYHPAALLRNPSMKREAWEDFKKIRSKMDEFGI